jgi:hypothetical protein
LVEQAPESLGHQPDRTEHVVVYLIGLVKHKPSYVPIHREIASVLKIETVDRFDTLSGETIPSQKPLCFKWIFVVPII